MKQIEQNQPSLREDMDSMRGNVDEVRGSVEQVMHALNNLLARHTKNVGDEESKQKLWLTASTVTYFCFCFS